MTMKVNPQTLLIVTLTLSLMSAYALWGETSQPDGQRFLMMNMQGSEGTRPKINVVLNWFEELKRLVPTEP